MKNMLNKIIEVDNEAKKITEQAQKDKVNAINKISENKQQLKDQLLVRAQKKIEETIVREKEKNKKNIALAEEDFEKKSKDLADTFEKNKSEWVDLVFKRVLEA